MSDFYKNMNIGSHLTCIHFIDKITMKNKKQFFFSFYYIDWIGAIGEVVEGETLVGDGDFDLVTDFIVVVGIGVIVSSSLGESNVRFKSA